MPTPNAVKIAKAVRIMTGSDPKGKMPKLTADEQVIAAQRSRIILVSRANARSFLFPAQQEAAATMKREERIVFAQQIAFGIAAAAGLTVCALILLPQASPLLGTVEEPLLVSEEIAVGLEGRFMEFLKAEQLLSKALIASGEAPMIYSVTFKGVTYKLAMELFASAFALIVATLGTTNEETAGFMTHIARTQRPATAGEREEAKTEIAGK